MAAVGNPKDISLLAFAIAALIAKTSAFINPIICFFWYTAYREKVKKLFGIRSPSGGDKAFRTFTLGSLPSNKNKTKGFNRRRNKTV